MSWGDTIRRHPLIASVLLTGVLAGAVLGFLFLDPDWSVARRVAAGAVAGGGIGFLMTATKML